MVKLNESKIFKGIGGNNYIKKIKKRSMMIIITSKMFKRIGGNNYIENIQRDRWEYLDQKYLKGSVGIPRSKNTAKLSSLNV